MTAIKKKPVDAVLVGFGWTGAIMAMELAEAGLNVLALERGPARDTNPDFAYPRIADELTYGIRYGLLQNLATETVTVRHTAQDQALPYRQLGSFLLGNGVGGAGAHWNGMHWRATASDLVLRSHYEQRYGKRFIPEDMTIQDWGITYDELEPYLRQVRIRMRRVGQRRQSRRPAERRRQSVRGSASARLPAAATQRQPTPPRSLQTPRARSAFKPFPSPSSQRVAGLIPTRTACNSAPCNFCGFCERFGCYMYSKASPQTTIFACATQEGELRVAHASARDARESRFVRQESDGRHLHRLHGREVEQPADLVILCAYQMHNVRLLLLSRHRHALRSANRHGLGRQELRLSDTCPASIVFFDKNVT